MLARQWENASWLNVTVTEAWRVGFNYVRAIEAVRCPQGKAMMAGVGIVVILTYPREDEDSLGQKRSLGSRWA